jgi:hypothetical protein
MRFFTVHHPMRIHTLMLPPHFSIERRNSMYYAQFPAQCQI